LPYNFQELGENFENYLIFSGKNKIKKIQIQDT